MSERATPGRSRRADLTAEVRAWQAENAQRKALQSYRRQREAEPEEGRWAQLEGELLVKLGELEAGWRAIGDAALRYARASLPAKAVAACRIALDLRPEMTELVSEVVATIAADPPSEVPTETGDLVLGEGEKLADLRLREIFEARQSEHTTLAWSVDLPTADPTRSLFVRLSPTVLRRLIADLEVRRYAPGQTIVRQGEQAREFFVLAEGSAQVYEEGPPRKQINELAAESFFGEVALLTSGARSATVQAQEHAVALVFSRALVTELVASSRRTLGTLLRFCADRLVNSCMHAGSCAERLSPNLYLGPYFGLVEVARGCTVLEAGRVADALYLVMTGSVSSTTTCEGTSTDNSTTLGPGQCFGAYSMLSRRPMESTVRAEDHAWLLQLKHDRLFDLVRQQPSVLQGVAALASDA